MQAVKLINVPITNCGLVQLISIDGVKDGRTVQYVPSTDPSKPYSSTAEYRTVEQAIITCLTEGGFCSKSTYTDPPNWDNTIGKVAAVCWTDAEYMGNGKALAEFFIKKGYKVQTTDIGINPRYGTANHFLRHYIAFTGPTGNIGAAQAARVSVTREYTYEQEQQNKTPEPANSTPEVRPARISKLRSVAGAGVRAFRVGRPLRTSIR